MSVYIRRKYADWKGNVQCFTCYWQGPWKEAQAGHFKHKYQDFNEKNIHPQCDMCNRWSYGRPNVYKQQLIKKYGESALTEIEELVKKERLRIDKKGYAYTKTELEKIIKDLTKKIGALDDPRRTT
jgi:hypothetical protein